MSEVKGVIAYGAVATVALAMLLFLFDRVASPVLREVETVVQPCQHSGTWDPDADACVCLGPWEGKYCGECTCLNGACSSFDVQVSTPGTLWGCRCFERWVGELCNVCNANVSADGTQCTGACQEGWYGADCDTRCAPDPTFEDVLVFEADWETEAQVLEWGGTLHVCSGHGVCDAAGACVCEPHYFPSVDGRSSCQRTCPQDAEGNLCAGHGQCSYRDTTNTVSCACNPGYLGTGCAATCPGTEEPDWVQAPCAGRGVCSLVNDDVAECACPDLYRGEACEYVCPTGALSTATAIPCSGHGACELTALGTACECTAPWTGPGCGCNSRTTCSGHGACDDASGLCVCEGNWRGARCNTCRAGYYGTDCTLKCARFKPDDNHVFVEGRDIHCHGRGSCAVADFALATERVICGACTGFFSPESHCQECRDDYYPKLAAAEALAAAEPGNVVYQDPASKSCRNFANARTCNFAGAPVDAYGLPGVTPCRCDADKADADSFCTQCQPTFHPADMQSADACTARCVDADDQPPSVDGYLTLACKNEGTCQPDGLSCACVNGYSGVDCGIGCGETQPGTPACSGHGQCVSDSLQQFLQHEIGVKGFNASRCVCDPQAEVSDAEKLAIFRGDEPALGGDAELKRDNYYGDTCQHQCLAPPWKDALECNDETCKVLPIENDAGTPLLACTQDSQCGEWVYDEGFQQHILRFEEEGALSDAQTKLRAALSAERRWSAQMGPFCHAPTLPKAVWTPKLQCRQRASRDAADPVKDTACHLYTTKYACLHSGGGDCVYEDACQHALDEFDARSYCYEILRTDEPAVLRGRECAAKCRIDDSDGADGAGSTLHDVDWHQVCANYTSRTPAAFQTCGNALDTLCDGEGAVKARVAACGDTLPNVPQGGAAASLTAPADVSAFCWETSGQANASAYPFGFHPVLDTSEARHLQSQFAPAFLHLGDRDFCLRDARADAAQCAALPALDESPAPVLYSCHADGVDTLSATNVFTNEVVCTPLPGLRDLDPFVLRCADGDTRLRDVTYAEAVARASPDCSLVPASALHASGVRVTFEQASATCAHALQVVDPTHCQAVCGDDHCVDLGTTFDDKRVFQCRPSDGTTFLPVGADGFCDRCDVGVCSLTGRDAGTQYRCVATAAELAAVEHAGAAFADCENQLLLHVDALGGGVTLATGVAGKYDVGQTYDAHAAAHAAMDDDMDDDMDAMGDTAGLLDGLTMDDITSTQADGGDNTPADDVLLDALLDDAAPPPAGEFVQSVAATLPERLEFDVTLASAGRGKVALEGTSGSVILSVKFHYAGGQGVHLDAVAQDAEPCATGEADGCKFTVAPLRPYRVVVEISDMEAVLTVRHADGSLAVRTTTPRNATAIAAGGFAGVRVAGTARVRDLWVFGAGADDTCAALHRTVGRAATMRTAAAVYAHTLPLTSVQFCARVEQAFGGTAAACDTARDATFLAPWRAYCAYADAFLNDDPPDCAEVQADRRAVVDCQPVLARFADVTCAKAAAGFDWDAEFCQPLAALRVPAGVVDAGCSDACQDALRGTDLGAFCADREQYWHANGTARSFVPAPCDDNGQWHTYDWVTRCTQLAENKVPGFCSAAVCSCRDNNNGFMGGNACELACPMVSVGVLLLLILLHAPSHFDLAVTGRRFLPVQRRFFWGGVRLSESRPSESRRLLRRRHALQQSPPVRDPRKMRVPAPRRPRRAGVPRGVQQRRRRGRLQHAHLRERRCGLGRQLLRPRRVGGVPVPESVGAVARPQHLELERTDRRNSRVPVRTVRQRLRLPQRHGVPFLRPAGRQTSDGGLFRRAGGDLEDGESPVRDQPRAVRLRGGAQVHLPRRGHRPGVVRQFLLLRQHVLQTLPRRGHRRVHGRPRRRVPPERVHFGGVRPTHAGGVRPRVPGRFQMRFRGVSRRRQHLPHVQGLRRARPGQPRRPRVGRARPGARARTHPVLRTRRVRGHRTVPVRPRRVLEHHGRHHRRKVCGGHRQQRHPDQRAADHVGHQPLPRRKMRVDLPRLRRDPQIDGGRLLGARGLLQSQSVPMRCGLRWRRM